MGQRKILNYYQQPHDTVPIYAGNLNNAIETLQHYVGELAPPPGLIDIVAKRHGVDVGDPNSDMRRYYERTHAYYAEAKEQRYAICLILHSDSRRFDLLIMRLSNDYAFGNDNYQRTRQQAAELLITFKPEIKKNYNPPTNPGMKMETITPEGCSSPSKARAPPSSKEWEPAKFMNTFSAESVTSSVTTLTVVLTPYPSTTNLPT